MVLEAFWKERALQKLPVYCCLFASPVINLQQMEGIDFMLEQRLYIIRLCSRRYFLYLFRPDMSLLSARMCVTVVFYLCGRYVPRNGDVHRNYVSFSLGLCIPVETRRRENPAMYLGNNLFHVSTVLRYMKSICWWCGLL
jgi:hypothetical protein